MLDGVVVTATGRVGRERRRRSKAEKLRIVAETRARIARRLFRRKFACRPRFGGVGEQLPSLRTARNGLEETKRAVFGSLVGDGDEFSYFAIWRGFSQKCRIYLPVVERIGLHL